MAFFSTIMLLEGNSLNYGVEAQAFDGSFAEVAVENILILYFREVLM